MAAVDLPVKNGAVGAESVEINLPNPTAPPTSTASSSEENAVGTAPEQPGTVWGIDRAIWDRARLLCFSVFYTMEYIGETVVSVLGLDESRYQYVMDGMDERDWEVARAVQARKDQAAQQGDNAA
jgi:hypothetical protein